MLDKVHEYLKSYENGLIKLGQTQKMAPNSEARRVRNNAPKG